MNDNDKPTCSICGGEGAVTAFGSYESADGTQPCQACNGTGKRIAELESQLAAAQERNADNAALKSELRERTDLLFSYALEAKGLEMQLAEVAAQNTRLTEAADWDTLNALSDEVEDYKKQLAAAQEYVATLESMVTSHSDKVEAAAAKYYRTLNTQMCVRCQKPGHSCECEPIDFEDMY